MTTTYIEEHSTASLPSQTQKHEEVMKKIVPINPQSGFMEFITRNLMTISYFDFETLRKAIDAYLCGYIKDFY
ncbi:unnamed protein product [Lathyrus oleraceus]